jgi:hypothetical protein
MGEASCNWKTAFIAQECYIAVKNRGWSLWKIEQHNQGQATGLEKKLPHSSEIRDNVRQTIWHARVKQVQGAQAKPTIRSPGANYCGRPSKLWRARAAPEFLQPRIPAAKG